VGVEFGPDETKAALSVNPARELRTGDLQGQGAPTVPVNGAFGVLEAFGEVEMPLIRHSCVDELSISGGYRKSWYTTLPGAGLIDQNGNAVVSRKYSTDTYKVSAEFAPIKDIRFRAAYTRAVR